MIVSIVDVMNTLWVGLIYAVIAVPLTLSYRTTQILNFVHINFMTIGAYVGAVLTVLGIRNFPLMALTAFAVGASIAVIDNALVFSPLIRRGANALILMISSLGLWIFYKYLIYAIVDYLSKVLKTNMLSLFIRVGVRGWYNIGGYYVGGKFIVTVITAVTAMTLLYLFLQKTRLGKAVRAVADNPDLAEISGIPKDRVIYVVWAISGGMATLGGLLWGLFSIVTPELGDTLILQIFAASVIGGLSSLALTVVGAFVISGAENLVTSALNTLVGLPVSFKPFLSFATLLIVILIKPPLGAGGGLPYRFRISKLLRRLR